MAGPHFAKKYHNDEESDIFLCMAVYLNVASPLQLSQSAMHHQRSGTTFALSTRHSVTQDCLYAINETENRSDTQFTHLMQLTYIKKLMQPLACR